MKYLNIFSLGELRRCAEDIVQRAEKGEITVITNQDRPSFIAVPFDEYLLKHGISRTVAVSLFETGSLTLVQAARTAGLTAEEFIELLGESGISAADYPPDELESELVFSPCGTNL
jgi:antitoxin (DNA-binding transcriptional repressor) of toxin-antitoxin stability system